MYKIRWLLMGLLMSSEPLTGQRLDGHTPVLRVRVSTDHAPKNHVQAVDRGPNGEPALPAKTPNPKPASVADRPDGVLFRRRKLTLRQRA